MSLLRFRAAEVFGAALAQYQPDLAGHICAGPADSGHVRRLPSVAIIPISFKFSPDQEEIWKEVGDTQAAVCVGRYDALFQLQVGAKNHRTRAKWCSMVESVFFKQEGRPGVLVVDVADCDDAILGFEYDDTSWRDEAGFSDKWFSVTTMNVAMPVLVRRAVPTMEEIRICLAADTAATFAGIDDNLLECVAVDEAGNVTATTPSPA